MPTLTERLLEDMKQAMRDRATARLEAIRYLRSQMQNREIELRHNLSDKDVIEIIRRLIRQREESIEQFRQANRLELVQKEEAELALLRSYLPPQPNRTAIEEVARAVIAEVGAQSSADMRKVMPVLLSRLQGTVDGRVVADVVSGLLREKQ